MTLVSGGFSGAAVSQRTRRCDADHNASRKQPHFWVEFAQVPCGQRLPRMRERDWARGQTTSITEWGAFDPLVIDCYHNGAGWSSLVARWAHNPKVGGSNPPPATKIRLILNGFRYEFGGRFCVWSQFRQILGNEFLIQKCPDLLGDTHVVRGYEMGVAQGGFGIDVTEPFLTDRHRCPKRIEQCRVTVPESVGSSASAVGSL
jgi:hypothetical protein